MVAMIIVGGTGGACGSNITSLIKIVSRFFFVCSGYYNLCFVTSLLTSNVKCQFTMFLRYKFDFKIEFTKLS